MAEIESIISKEAIDGIKAADEALKLFDTNMQASLKALTQYAADLKKQGLTFKDLANASKALAAEQKKQNDIVKQSEKIIKEAESAYKALDKQRQAGLAKMAAEEAKQRQYNSTEQVAIRQNKQLTEDIKRLTKVGEKRSNDMAKEAATLAKLAAKEKEHTEALKLEVKTVNDAIRQNKALTAERNKAATTFGKQSAEVQAYNRQLQANTEFIRNNGTAMEKQRMNIGNYKSALAGIGTSLAGAFSVTAVLAFGKASFAAFEEQEQANRKLLFSLKGNKQAFKELTEQANDFQSRTGIADDAIQGIQTLAAEAGKSTVEIKKITEASINWSKITGQDLQSAYLQVNATLNGTAGRLTRVDAEFGKLTKSQLESGAAIDLINTKYKDFAENAASDTEKLSANWGEFIEMVGSGVAKVAVPALNSINTLLRITTADSLTFMDKLRALTQGAAGVAVAMGQIEGNKIAEANKSNAQNSAIRNDPATQTLIAQAQASGKAKAQLLDYSAAFEEYEKSQKKTSDKVNKQVGEYAMLTQKLSDAKEAMLNMLAAGETPTDQARKNIRDLEVQIYNIEQAAKDAAKELITLAAPLAANQIGDRKTGNTSILQKRASVGSGGAAANAAPGLFSNPEAVTELAISTAQTTSDTIFSIIAQSTTAEYDLKLSLLDKEKEAKLANANLTEKQRLKIEQDYAKKAAKIKTEQFKKEKAASIIQSIINTAVSVTANLKNPLLAIAAGIAGAAQTAIIASQDVPQFDAGVLKTPSEFIAGERRPEWMIEPSGRVQLVTKPTHFKNMAGATVIGGAETQRMLQQGIAPAAADIRPDIQAMRADIVNAIRNKAELHISGSSGRITERTGNYYKTYFNKKVRWAGRNN